MTTQHLTFTDIVALPIYTLLRDGAGVTYTKTDEDSGYEGGLWNVPGEDCFRLCDQIPEGEYEVVRPTESFAVLDGNTTGTHGHVVAIGTFEAMQAVQKRGQYLLAVWPESQVGARFALSSVRSYDREVREYLGMRLGC